MTGTVGKVGGEIRIGRRRRAESETDRSSRNNVPEPQDKQHKLNISV